ncbi:hypothetical protein AOQ84DRAFT_333731 [Glonium stellatum]|uniref:Uncharacterized protein n=1 Tax=Glonium stellatum TaxID=574774 RepID=A0A8E2F9Z3_9PEZI|nr:hypothetical protein AOQ84DRAFT_333731 [Glonium stellatum]
MGSNDAPPPHVPVYYLPVSNGLLQAGGVLWTIAYILFVRSSFRTRSYGMPILALAFNFAWEIVFALYVAESPLERSIFTIWMILDLGLVYCVVVYGQHEWAHSPAIARNLGKIFTLLTAGALAGHWTFAKWWIDNDIGKREGKFYMGRMGPDTTELGYWTVAFCQSYLSAASLAQLVVRGHSGGVGWGIWATRTLGSLLGFVVNYAWCWYYWREAHEYFMSPFSVFLIGVGLMADLLYPFVLLRIRKTETVSSDGRRIRGDDLVEAKRKRG